MAEITLGQMREKLYSAVVCDALDGLGFRNQSPRVQLRPLTGQGVLIGRCKTTLWAEMGHEDPRPYELELKAVDSCQPDDVMICAAGGSSRSALWGELLSTACRRAGAVGAIVDGAVRDVVKMTAMGFPCFARATLPYDSRDRNRVIDVDVAVEIDGVRFSPGDLVVADVDGVVVVPRSVEGDVIAAAWKKVNAENVVREAIAGGMTSAEAFKKYGVL
ncbi:MAG TPA: RraA family protein [Pirellulaceae bacterium]|jgi:regulator of RNase E activity RraA